MRQGEQPAVPVLYEDNHLIVVVKPVNMPTQPDESGDPDLLSTLKDELKAKYGKPGNVYLGLVHRLDRPVGGVMVFAKTSKAASRLSDMVRTRSFGKAYLAVVHGRPEPESGRLVHFLAKDERTNTVRIVPSTAHGAKEAVLDYESVGFREKFSLVRIKLLTGRTHQIRVQFAGIGCPLYGDQKYGAEQNKPGQQIALWSTELSFLHPTKKTPLVFRARPPSTYPWTLWDDSYFHHDD